MDFWGQKWNYNGTLGMVLRWCMDEERMVILDLFGVETQPLVFLLVFLAKCSCNMWLMCNLRGDAVKRIVGIILITVTCWWFRVDYLSAAGPFRFNSQGPSIYVWWYKGVGSPRIRWRQWRPVAGSCVTFLQ